MSTTSRNTVAVARGRSASSTFSYASQAEAAAQLDRWIGQAIGFVNGNGEASYVVTDETGRQFHVMGYTSSPGVDVREIAVDGSGRFWDRAEVRAAWAATRPETAR